MNTFIEKHIKTEADLPQVDGEYFVNRAGFKSVFEFKKGFSEMMWMKEIRSYIQPLSISKEEGKGAEEWGKVWDNEFNSPIINDLIAKIKPIKANLDYCSENHRINGSLLMDIKNAMIQYRIASLPAKLSVTDEDIEIEMGKRGIVSAWDRVQCRTMARWVREQYNHQLK